MTVSTQVTIQAENAGGGTGPWSFPHPGLGLLASGSPTVYWVSFDLSVKEGMLQNLGEGTTIPAIQGLLARSSRAQCILSSISLGPQLMTVSDIDVPAQFSDYNNRYYWMNQAISYAQKTVNKNIKLAQIVGSSTDNGSLLFENVLTKFCNPAAKYILFDNSSQALGGAGVQCCCAITLAGCFGFLPVATSGLSTVQTALPNVTPGKDPSGNTLDMRTINGTTGVSYDWLWTNYSKYINHTPSNSVMFMNPGQVNANIDYCVFAGSFMFDGLTDQAYTTNNILANLPFGTPFLGFWSGVNPAFSWTNGNEVSSVAYLTQNGGFSAHVADRGAGNTTFTAALPKIGAQGNVAMKKLTFDKSGNTVYVCWCESQGDAWAYMSSNNWSDYNDETLGTGGTSLASLIPVSFPFSNELALMHPEVMNGWYSKQNSLTYFFAGPGGGVGYCHLSQLPANPVVIGTTTYPNGESAWLQGNVQPLMTYLGQNGMFVIDDQTPFTTTMADISSRSSAGFFSFCTGYDHLTGPNNFNNKNGATGGETLNGINNNGIIGKTIYGNSTSPANNIPFFLETMMVANGVNDAKGVAIGPTTTTSGTNAQGQNVLNVASSTGFFAGQIIDIDSGAATREFAVIQSTSSGTLTLASKLLHAHPGGQTVIGNDLSSYVTGNLPNNNSPSTQFLMIEANASNGTLGNPPKPFYTLAYNTMLHLPSNYVAVRLDQFVDLMEQARVITGASNPL